MKLDRYTVGTRYAKALFELADEKQQLQSVFSELIGLRQISAENPELGEVLVDPRLNLIQKRALMSSLTKEFSPLVQKFLQLIFDYGRMSCLTYMIDEFELMYHKKNNTILAKVTTAVALSPDQEERLAQSVAQRFEVEQAVLTLQVNPIIMGGVVVEANHTVYDGSVKTKLERMKASLLK